MSTHQFVPDESGLYCAVCDLVRKHPRHGTGETLQQAHARRTDPSTSHAAAAAVQDLSAQQSLVLKVLREIGPSTDEALADYWQTNDVSSISPSGLRTRRRELVEHGLVEDTGQLALTVAGHSSIVWAVTDHG